MANQPDAAASAEVEVVLTLIEQCRKLENGKKTVYGTYLQCIKKNFEKDNPNCTFQESLMQLAVKNWKEMPESRKSQYRQLNKEQHELINMKCHVLEQRAIAARTGVRDYGGRPIKEPPQESVEELTFNPLLWFLLEQHAINSRKPKEYAWKDDIGKLFRDAAKNWPELPQTDRQRFINKAKAERSLHNEKKLTEKDNEKYIRKILKKKLEEWIVKEL